VLEDFIVASKIEIPVISILTPIPGTKLYEAKKDQIIIDDLDYYTFTNAVTRTKMPEDLFYSTFAAIMNRLHEKPHKPQ
jgi:hypothetical protein